MNKKQKNIQLTLALIGFLLIIGTYFYYPMINKNKSTENQSTIKKFGKPLDENETTTFKNVEYRGTYDFDKTFEVKSEDAYILLEEPDIVYMINMHVVLYLSKGRVVSILSNKGKYNKVTYDCFFKENVRATDGTTKIFADNMDLLATNNSAKIYDNVTLNYATGYLKADKIDYDFETKYFKVSMYDEEQIKMKVIK